MKNDSKKTPYGWLKLALELFVVFAGVTAGFLLNNWWGQRTNKHIQTSYYERFITELESDLSTLKQINQSDSAWIEKYKYLNKEFSDNHYTHENVENAIRSINNLIWAELTSTTYQEITNCGKWYILDDYEITSELHNYYGNIQLEISSLKDSFLNFCYSYIMPFILKNFSSYKDCLFNYNESIALEAANYYVYMISFKTLRIEKTKGYIESTEALIASIKDAI